MLLGSDSAKISQFRQTYPRKGGQGKQDFMPPPSMHYELIHSKTLETSDPLRRYKVELSDLSTVSRDVSVLADRRERRQTEDREKSRRAP